MASHVIQLSMSPTGHILVRNAILAMNAINAREVLYMFRKLQRKSALTKMGTALSMDLCRNFITQRKFRTAIIYNIKLHICNFRFHLLFALRELSDLNSAFLSRISLVKRKI